MNQNKKESQKNEEFNPMAIWWRTISQSQQMMQDNTRKMMTQMLSQQEKIMRMCLGDDKKEKSGG